MHVTVRGMTYVEQAPTVGIPTCVTGILTIVLTFPYASMLKDTDFMPKVGLFDCRRVQSCS